MHVTTTSGRIKSHQEVEDITIVVPNDAGDYKIFIREYNDGDGDDDGDETETCVFAEHPSGERECIWSMLHPA